MMFTNQCSENFVKRPEKYACGSLLFMELHNKTSMASLHRTSCELYLTASLKYLSGHEQTGNYPRKAYASSSL